MRLRTIAIVALLACAAHPARAQEPQEAPRSLPNWSLEHTMREFLEAYVPRGFFPTRGDWTWVVTTHHADGPDRIGLFRFRAEETDSAMAPGGPVCDSFHAGDVFVAGTVVANAVSQRPWRRVRGTRFVPPGRPASSPVFVEWRREDGRWVVSRFGEETEHGLPEPPGTVHRGGIRGGPRGEPLRLPLPDTLRVAADAAWYQQNEPINVAGARVTKYGLPRPLADNDVVRWGTMDGVAIYVEPMDLKLRVPGVVYLPVDRTGLFQPYQNITGNGCEH